MAQASSISSSFLVARDERVIAWLVMNMIAERTTLRSSSRLARSLISKTVKSSSSAKLALPEKNPP